MKLCRHCKHIEKDDENYRYARCNAPQNTKIDIVSGGIKRNYEFCSTLRASSDECGLDANWFKPNPIQEFVKTKIPLFKRIFRKEYWEPK